MQHQQPQPHVHLQHKHPRMYSNGHPSMQQPIPQANTYNETTHSTPLYHHLPHLEHQRGSMPSPPTDEFHSRSPQQQAVMTRPHTAPMPIFPLPNERPASHGGIYHGPERLSPIAHPSNNASYLPVPRSMHNMPSGKSAHGQDFSPRMPVLSLQRLHPIHGHANMHRGSSEFASHGHPHLPLPQFHTPESPLAPPTHMPMHNHPHRHNHHHHHHHHQQQHLHQTRDAIQPPMIPIVRSPTHHGHPLYHQNQRMTVRPTPITPTTPVNATLQSNHHQTTESHIERVSYVNATASNHVPNHSGNIVFSVGLNNSGSHGKPVNGSTASSSAGVPPANTMASQISKFRATRRIVDKRDHQRRVSHSAIERRRRERINSEIGHLRRLVPSCRGQDHLHKLSVLQGAIAYIHELRRQLGIKDEASDLDPTLNAQLHDSNAEDDMEASDADNEVVFDSCSPVDSTPPADALRRTPTATEEDHEAAVVVKEED